MLFGSTCYVCICRYLIGADGRRSIVRRQRFGDQLCRDYNVTKIVFCKYEVVGTSKALSWLQYIQLSQGNSAVSHTVKEIVGRPDQGKTAVTLQVFVSSSEFDQLRDYTAKSPASIQSLRHSSLQPLAGTLEAWIKARMQWLEEEAVSEPRINPVPLDVYQAASVAKRDSHNRIWALVGDAAFGLPFFRALNDGLRCATALSKAIVDDYTGHEEADPILQYQQYFSSLALKERVMVSAAGATIKTAVAVKSSKRFVKNAKVAFCRGLKGKIIPRSGETDAAPAEGPIWDGSSRLDRLICAMDEISNEGAALRAMQAVNTEIQVQQQAKAALADVKLPAGLFYDTYYGHDVLQLEMLHYSLRAQRKQSIVWLTGDSTLDNKDWFEEKVCPLMHNHKPAPAECSLAGVWGPGNCN